VQALLQALEHTFGKIDRNDNDFTCVGIRHFRDRSGSITLDQHEYIKSMNPIRHPDLVGGFKFLYVVNHRKGSKRDDWLR
jgi:hypothetical protein